ncbi:MAG: aspartate aminotransferase family protein [Alphaproteobacteria bacterium]|nr:aspartate aminotransferase family protein [Alphaproteobacteria bacterium]
MDKSDFTKWSNRATDWGQTYLDTLRERPVRAQVSPGEIMAKLPPQAPEQPEDMEEIFNDFANIVPDGMTHWQHPRFFAYFPANAAPASMIAEQLANTMAAQCMLWQTSPAATEIETRMVEWLRDALGLAPHFSGVIQDSATSSTLSAILTMRERALSWRGNKSGLSGEKPVRIYASAQTHSSIDKACWIAGIGQQNLVKIPTDAHYSMSTQALRAAIRADRKAGFLPAGIVICVGGTSIGATDDVAAIIEVAKDENLYTHVDAAWAGSAMICPEFRPLWHGVDGADSIVFNPHKWLGAQFDCSVQFLAEPSAQIRTLGLRPEYLKTQGAGEITNYNEWTVPLGRRFRALKLWFLLRAYGLEGLRTRIRNHVAWVKELEGKLAAHPDFTIITELRFSLFTFQYTPKDGDANALTAALLAKINDDGRIYLTQTQHEGKFVIRMTAGQFDCTRDDVMAVYDVLVALSARLSPQAHP